MEFNTIVILMLVSFILGIFAGVSLARPSGRAE